MIIYFHHVSLIHMIKIIYKIFKSLNDVISIQGDCFMIYLLKNLRIISVIGCLLSLLLLIINIICMIFIDKVTVTIHYSWIAFFSIALCSSLSSLTGYLINLRYQFIKRNHLKKETLSN